MATHAEVAHRWSTRWEVNGRKLKGLSSAENKMWSEGDSIYSYGTHFEIARYVDTTPKKGVNVPSRAVLFTTRTHGNATSKHKGHVRHAIPRHVPVFYVPALAPGYHALNLADYEARAEEMYAKALRARVYGPSQIKWAEDLLKEAESYAKHFGVKYTRPDPSALSAKLAKVRAKQEAEDKKRRKEAKEARKRHEQERRERDAEQFALWQSGDSWRCPDSYRVDANGNAYVRHIDGSDGEVSVDELQTSQGVSVPWEHAVKVFRFVKLVRERGIPWQRNGHSIRVGHYVVDLIDVHGNMVAGCHRITWEAMETLAIKEGIAGFAASSEVEEVS